MRYAGIDECDLCNGNNIGMSLYVQGCDAHCLNCFNPETWDFDGGEEWTEEKEKKFFELVSRDYIKRITFVGGEPLADRNIRNVAKLIEDIKNRYDKQVWVYTGFTMESIQNMSEQYPMWVVLTNADFIVENKYIDSLHDSTLAFRGSSNQRIFKRTDNNEWVDVTDQFERG